MYLGSWKLNDLLTFVVNTHSVSTGAAVDADSVPTYRVYEDETTTPILAGSMALLDGANTAGFYSEQIALSAANGFELGKSYNVYISAIVGGVTGTIGRTFQMQAEVALPALVTDTYAEPASVPAATASLKDKIGWLFVLARNKVTQTSTTQTVKADNGTTTIATSTVSDDGTTFERGEFS